eukprot:9431822-Alexandrium_andersonii.AAC.1
MEATATPWDTPRNSASGRAPEASVGGCPWRGSAGACSELLETAATCLQCCCTFAVVRWALAEVGG